MVKRILLIIALVVVVFSLFGCETFKGVGRDIKTAGEAVEDTAETVDDKI